MKRFWIMPIAALVLVAGCFEDDHHGVVSPRDATAPAAPRGLYSVTGDGEVFLHWQANTESDIAGYRVYKAPCSNGSSCPYDLVGVTTGTSFTVSSLANGETRYYAVAAYDRAGNESDLSYNDVYDTPRPEGFGRSLTNATDGPSTAGYDFSAFAVVPWNDTQADVYYSTAGGTLHMVAPFTDTEIQDAGYASSLDAVDFAPPSGWSPSGTVELIVGHCYVLKISSSPTVANYAKFRVTSLNSTQVTFDWAYQTDPNNGELSQKPTRTTARVRRSVS